MSEIMKAFRNGKRGKFRRVDGGKVKFIRSHDNVVEKTTDSDVDPTECVCKDGEPCGCPKKDEVEKEFPAEREANDPEGGKVCKFCGKTAEEGCDHMTAVEKLDQIIATLETKQA